MAVEVFFGRDDWQLLFLGLYQSNRVLTHSDHSNKFLRGHSKCIQAIVCCVFEFQRLHDDAQ